MTPSKAYSKGLLFLEKDTKIQSTSLTNEGIEELSDNLLTRLNVGDYFDRQIYVAAYSHSILLTEDGELHDLFKKAGTCPSQKK